MQRTQLHDGTYYYHYLTGDLDAQDAVKGLAGWVVAMDDGRRSAFRLLDHGATGLASRTYQDEFHGPGRGSGNSINALLDAWLASNDNRYMTKVEELIQRCIHPQTT